jgi:hypothetical protein
MRTHLVTYATSTFLPNAILLARSARRHGVDVIHRFGRRDLTRSVFYSQHRDILDLPRGGGYWLWKPFFIRQVLQSLDEGDLLLYADAGMECVADVGVLGGLCRDNGGILLFGERSACAPWIKRECFFRMNCNTAQFWQADMASGGVMLFQKSYRSLAFVNEWLGWCCDPGVLTDIPSDCGEPELEAFIEHRHEMAVLTVLATRENIPHFRLPFQAGNYLKMPAFRRPGEYLSKPYSNAPFENSPYPTIFEYNRNTLLRLFQRLAYVPALLHGDRVMWRLFKHSIAGVIARLRSVAMVRLRQ